MVLVTAPAPKAIELRLTAHVSTLTNVLKILTLVATMLHVLTLKADINASASQDIKEILTMVSAHRLNVAAPLIESAAPTKNVFNLVSAFVLLRSSSMLEMFVEILARDLHVESMRNVVQLIHHNVCVKLVLKAILCLGVLVPMNVQTPPALMELNASIKRAATNAFVLRECLAIHTKVAAFSKILKLADRHVNRTTIVHRIFIVVMELVLVLVLICYVAQMHFANLKIMLDGVDAELVTKTAIAVIVFQVN